MNDWIIIVLAASRPDIIYAVCVCSRFQETSKESHLVAVKRILRYLQITLDYSL